MQRKPGPPSGDPETAAHDEPSEFRVEDRRHWSRENHGETGETADAEPRKPTLIGEYRARAEAAEARLQEYIQAFKQHQQEQDEFRARLERDVDRRVELKFSSLVRDLLETVDTLELGLRHAAGIPGTEALTAGMVLARDRFLAILERNGIERIEPHGAPFDPNEAEAVRVDPIDSPEQDGWVSETLQPGFRLGEHVIRPARVAVGRKSGARG